MYNVQEASSQWTEGHGGPGGEDRFSRRARVRCYCGVGAAPCQPWDSAWRPHFRPHFRLTCRVGRSGGLSFQGKGMVCGGRAPGTQPPRCLQGHFQPLLLFFFQIFQLLFLQMTGKDTWAWPGLCLVVSAPLVDTCEDAQITGQRPWCHHPRDTDPCPLRSPGGLF